MKSKNNNRRRFLQLGLGATAGIITTGIGCKTENNGTTSAGCTTTAEQAIGPFYPYTKIGDGDLDLTTIQGKEGQAEGEIILVKGRITDGNCQPIKDALVEIWQANKYGRYSHEGDANNPNPLDPNFEGWGEMTTSETGEYSFKTIKPGPYSIGTPENPDDWRTPHIHFKVSRRGFHEVVTQMYFAGEPLNEKDNILGELPKEEQGQFIIEPVADKSGTPVFNFNISLDAVKTKEQRKEALAAFTGTYEVDKAPESLAPFTIRQDGELLYLDMADKTTVELRPKGEDELISHSAYLRLVFNRDNDGGIDSLVVYNTSRNYPSEPLVGKRM